jgi:hypothetical protein
MHARLLHEESSSNPRISTALTSIAPLAVTTTIAIQPNSSIEADSLPPEVRRPINDERRPCQADPKDLVYLMRLNDLARDGAAARPYCGAQSI